MFRNVCVEEKANLYFDGRVSSRTIHFDNGTRKTLGIMLPGDYEFGTAEKELMAIQAGKLEVLLPGAYEWQAFCGGESFEVPAGAKFKVRVLEVVDYCCSYLKE